MIDIERMTDRCHRYRSPIADVAEDPRPGPDKLAELRHRLHEIAVELADTDDPEGEAVSLLIGLHRRDGLASTDNADSKEQQR